MMLLNMRPLPFGLEPHAPQNEGSCRSRSLYLSAIETHTHFQTRWYLHPALFKCIYKVPTIVVGPTKYLATRISSVSSFSVSLL